MENNWPNDNLTEEQALFVRNLRCGNIQHSWRRIAEICSDKWNGNWGDNQLAGQDICKSAANHFKENYNEPPWN